MPTRPAPRTVTSTRRCLLRLREVILFGSHARGDAHPGSDIDLLVVLDAITSPWNERRRIEPIAWKHSLAYDTVVTVMPMSARDLADDRWPILRRARAEGQRVA